MRPSTHDRRGTTPSRVKLVRSKGSWWRLGILCVLLFCLLTAGSGSAQAATRPGSGTFHGPLAVLVDWLPSAAPTSTAFVRSYRALLVNTKGKTVASVTAIDTSGFNIPGAAPPNLPVVSASSTRLYYLSGNNQVRDLEADGSTHFVATLPQAPHTLIAFSVSPDDQQLAVVVLTYTLVSEPSRSGSGTYLVPSAPVHIRLYIQDLRSGKHHEVFSTTTAKFSDPLIWPVGWRGSALILAVGDTAEQQGPPNPYDAWFGYHVASVSDGTRLANVCTTSTTPGQSALAAGPLVTTGSLCMGQGSPTNGAALYLKGWDESCTWFSSSSDLYFNGFALAPNGSRVAAYNTKTQTLIFLPRLPGRPQPGSPQTLIPTTITQSPLGWIDANDLVLEDYGFDTQPPTVYNVTTGARSPITSLGNGSNFRFMGVLPGGLGTITPKGPAGSGAC